MSEDTDQAMRDVVKGAGIVYAGILVELLIALVAQILAARFLSVDGFGGLTAGTALLDIGAILGGLGLAAGLRRYFPRIETDQKRMLALVTVAVTLLSSTVIGALVALNAEFIATDLFGSPEIAVSIRVFGAAIPFVALLNVAVGGIQGQERSLYRVYANNIIHPTARFVFVIGAVVYGLGQAGFAGAYALPYVLSGAIALWFLHRSLPAARTRLDRGLVTEVTRYSLPFTVTHVSGFVYRSIDIFLVLYFLGDTATGIYGVAYAAVNFMRMYSTAFNYLGAPIASKLESTGNVADVMDMFRSIARWLLVASVVTLIPLGVFAPDFIGVIYGSKYEQGGAVLTVLAIGFAATNVLNVHGPILEALGRSKLLSFNSTVAAITNIALNLVLVPRYGIVGAAVATTVSYLLRDGLATVQVYASLDATPLTWNSLKPLVLAVPFLFLVALGVEPVVPTTFLWLVATTGATATVYLVLVLVVFGLSDTEVMIVRSAQQRYGLDFGPIDVVVRRLER